MNLKNVIALVSLVCSLSCLAARADQAPPSDPQTSKPIQQTVRRNVLTPPVPLLPAVEPQAPPHQRVDHKEARRLARDHWLEKTAAASPEVIAGITRYRDAARILAKHPRLGEIAAADHYLCRQLTKWKGASKVLAKNGQARAVIEYDPEGIYIAVRRSRSVAHILAKNPEFNQMVVDNPDLGKVIASCF